MPGARVDKIRLRLDGAVSLRIGRDGSLVAETGNGEIRMTPPTAYQERNGIRSPVAATYVLRGRGYGFRLSDYDGSLPLVIDPFFQVTYLGGSLEDRAFGIVVRSTSGEVLVAGYTCSSDFPGVIAGAQAALSGTSDAFVGRLNPTLTSLLQATYLGGGKDEAIIAVALHPSSGEVLVAGVTTSTDFPGTSGGAQPAYGGGTERDGFVARLDPTLTTLLQATYVGGSNDDIINALAIHPSSGEVVVAGATGSTDLLGTSAGAQPEHGGGFDDGFVARLDSQLTTLLRATYLGGTGNDLIYGIGVHPSTGEVIVAGYTSSKDFPATSGGAQPGPGDNFYDDGFVARFDSTLATLFQATYLGGGNEDIIGAVAINPSSQEVLVAGYTSSTDFPGTAGGAQPGHAGGSYDGIVARLSPTLGTLLQTTYLGGGQVDAIGFIAVHPSTGEVLVAGSTSSLDFPGTSHGLQPEFGGGPQDGFVARLSPTLAALHGATYVGGTGADIVYAVAFQSPTGEVFASGATTSTDLPRTSGGAQPALGGGMDGFVARMTTDLAAPPNLSFYTLTPCRLADTRTTDPPALAAAAERVFTPGGKCGIPVTAQALSVNVTITQATAAGHVRLYPAGATRPLVSTVNYSLGQTRAGNAILKLGDGGAFTAFCGQASGTVQFIVDVNGYFQ
ncbi:MAG TPA: hypothetical protein VMR54_02550 [Thermoanaerobaculia bacterium]|nr:hypothetical protein [Thermoanaerobaculia bacterium]